MNFHGRIMNIAASRLALRDAESVSAKQAYSLGHRDARHAAAEIANEADARIAELVGRIRWLEYALAAIIASAGECDVPSDGVGVPLVSVDHRLIEDARGLVNSPKGEVKQ